MKFNDLAVDSAALEAGEWRDAVGLPKGHRFKVRGLDTLDYRRLHAKLLAALPKDQQIALDPSEDDRMTGELLHGAVLQDWDGFVDDAGQPMPYNAEAALQMLTTPDFVRFRNIVMLTARQFSAETRADREAAAKN